MQRERLPFADPTPSLKSSNLLQDEAVGREKEGRGEKKKRKRKRESIFFLAPWWMIISSVISAAWETLALWAEDNTLRAKVLRWIFSRLDNWSWCEQMLDWIIFLFCYTLHSHKSTRTHTLSLTYPYAYYTGYPGPTHSNWHLCAISATSVLCAMI